MEECWIRSMVECFIEIVAEDLTVLLKNGSARLVVG